VAVETGFIRLGKAFLSGWQWECCREVNVREGHLVISHRAEVDLAVLVAEALAEVALVEAGKI
jgi:hypothetical protein